MKDIRTAIKAQIAVADEIESDFIGLTKAEGLRILEQLEEYSKLQERHPVIVCPHCGKRVK